MVEGWENEPLSPSFVKSTTEGRLAPRRTGRGKQIPFRISLGAREVNFPKCFLVFEGDSGHNWEGDGDHNRRPRR